MAVCGEYACCGCGFQGSEDELMQWDDERVGALVGMVFCRECAANIEADVERLHSGRATSCPKCGAEYDENLMALAEFHRKHRIPEAPRCDGCWDAAKEGAETDGMPLDRHIKNAVGKEPTPADFEFLSLETHCAHYKLLKSGKLGDPMVLREVFQLFLWATRVHGAYGVRSAMDASHRQVKIAGHTTFFQAQWGGAMDMVGDQGQPTGDGEETRD